MIRIAKLIETIKGFSIILVLTDTFYESCRYEDVLAIRRNNNCGKWKQQHWL